MGTQHNTAVARFFHPLLTLIASSTDWELARYVQFLKAENRILPDRIPGQVHTKPAERQRVVELGKSLGQAEDLKSSSTRLEVNVPRNMQQVRCVIDMFGLKATLKQGPRTLSFTIDRIGIRLTQTLNRRRTFVFQNLYEQVEMIVCV